MMNTFAQDLRYGWRTMIKRPGFTLVAIATLALGIGANTAIFSLVDAVLLKPLPYEKPERLMTLWQRQRGRSDPGWDKYSLSYPNFKDWRAQNRSFEDIGAFEMLSLNLTGTGEPERLRAGAASASLLPILRQQPTLGRNFLPEEDLPESAAVALISRGLWQRRFGSDPSIVGKQIQLDGRNRTIVGVLPAEFRYPPKLEVLIPLAPRIAEIRGPNGTDESIRGFCFLRAVARLKDGVSVGQAREELDLMAQAIGRQYDQNDRAGAVVNPLQEELVGADRRPLLILFGAVGFILLIACANVANLLLARAAARSREIAIRAALGAGRARLLRQLLTESLMLALAGAAAGLLIALWGQSLLVKYAPGTSPEMFRVEIDARVFGFTLLASLIAGLLFGIAPALQSSRVSLNEALKDAGKGIPGATRHRVRTMLIISEVALAMMLLAGAGLMLKSFSRLLNESPGFDAERVLTFQVSLPRAKYANEAGRVTFFREAIGRLGTLPGVESVGVAKMLPLGGSLSARSFGIEGQPQQRGDDFPVAVEQSVSRDYFRAMNIRLREGRYFDERDVADARAVVIVNEALVRRYFNGRSPLGKRLIMGEANTPHEIIGVTGNVKNKDLTQPIDPETYIPYTIGTGLSSGFVVKTHTADPAQLTAAVRATIQGVDPDQPIYSVRPMEDLIYDNGAAPRTTTVMLSIFAALALILASIGIYGVISYSVAQRTPEIGVRVALGAGRRDVLRLIIGKAMKPVGVGVVVGLVGSLALARVIASLLYGVSAYDPLVFGGTALLLGAIALAACYLPARRATRVDPVIVLRYE